MTQNGNNQLEVNNQSAVNQPASKVDILFLFKDAIKSDGSVDGRSSYGRSLRAVKEMIQANKYDAAESIITNDIAMLTTIEKAIECYALSNPEAIFKDNELNPLLTGSLLKFRELKYRALNLLLNLNKKGKGKGKERDLSELFLE